MVWQPSPACPHGSHLWAQTILFSFCSYWEKKKCAVLNIHRIYFCSPLLQALGHPIIYLLKRGRKREQEKEERKAETSQNAGSLPQMSSTARVELGLNHGLGTQPMVPKPVTGTQLGAATCCFPGYKVVSSLRTCDVCTQVRLNHQVNMPTPCYFKWGTWTSCDVDILWWGGVSGNQAPVATAGQGLGRFVWSRGAKGHLPPRQAASGICLTESSHP